ncbi:ERV1/ALR-related protein [Flavobacteriaceae bacterium]|nr:ERV1/ALR-related protein [Flavobacteriaceae bacterium]|tara:strand:- start:191 stop:631 length:441 start_codon:yes stop_codon:yes gene_type:complete
MTEKSFDPTVWGPHYWFFLMTLAVSYPLKANETTKKKYYDFITNLPLFIPHPKIGNNFSKLLDKYPVSPYLEGKDSFLKWVHFIHNKINIEIGKDEQTFTESLDIYYELYKPKEIIMREQIKYRKKLLFGVIIVALVGGGYYLYKK